MNCDTAPSAKTPDSGRALHHICLQSQTRKGFRPSLHRSPRGPRGAWTPLRAAKQLLLRGRCCGAASTCDAATATRSRAQRQRCTCVTARRNDAANRHQAPASVARARPLPECNHAAAATKEAGQETFFFVLPVYRKPKRMASTRRLFRKELHALVVRGVAFE